MTTETTSDRSPEEILAAAKSFFLGEGAEPTAWLEREGETHLSFATFRGNLAVAAFPDPADPGRTRVRITTLRDEGIVPRLVAYLSRLPHGAAEEGEDD